MFIIFTLPYSDVLLITFVSVILFSEALDHDKTPEVIKKKNYAVFVLTQSQASETVEVMQTGPLAVGDLFEDYHILPMKFNVKKPKGVVHTCFCELKHTITNDHLHLCQIWNLEPAHLLPENANTQGCLHYSSHNIHHPKGERTFQNGGILYLISMCSKIRANEHYLSESCYKESTKWKVISMKGSQS